MRWQETRSSRVTDAGDRLISCVAGEPDITNHVPRTTVLHGTRRESHFRALQGKHLEG